MAIGHSPSLQFDATPTTPPFAVASSHTTAEFSDDAFRTLWISPSAFYSPRSLALWSSHGGSPDIVDVEWQYGMSLHHLIREQIKGSHSRHYRARGIGKGVKRI